MKKIRQNVFETNSSSVHSLVISSEGLEPSNLKIDPKTDHIIVNTQYFGKEYNIYNTQEDKLSYLITYIITALQYKYDNQEILEVELFKDYRFIYVENIIKNYCNCSGITVVINEEGGFDHQTSPYQSDCIIDFYDDSETIENFIFNKYISLKTSWD